MKVRDLNGYEHSWNLSGKRVYSNETKPRSEPHLRARELLKEEYPVDTILEEVYIPGESLFLDFYLPNRRMAVEVHGQQHYDYVPFFHPNKIAFHKGKANDRRKIEWCNLNNIKIVELSYKESIDEWRARFRD